MVCLTDHITSDFLKAVVQKFYFVHSWISWPVCWTTQSKPFTWLMIVSLNFFPKIQKKKSSKKLWIWLHAIWSWYFCSMYCGLISFEGAFFQCLSIGVLKSLAEKILGKIWSEIRGRLTHLFPMLHFDTPCKYQKTLRFCDISRGYGNVILVPSGLRDAKCYLKFVD